MYKLFLLAQFILPLSISAQNYSVVLIPDSLFKNANVIVRFDETRITVKSPGDAIVKHKIALTILNEKGDRYADYFCSYDKFRKFVDAEGKLFDKTGIKIKSTKKKDFEDVAYSGFSLITDNRVKFHNFFCKNYPYTIEYEDELSLDGIAGFPEWHPLNENNYSVQKSTFIVEMPDGYNLRYKILNNALLPAVTISGKNKVYSWEVNNLNAIDDELYQPSIEKITPGVLIGPDEFEYGGYKGNMNTWKNYGNFINELNKGRDILPDEIKNEVHKLTDGLTSVFDKTKILYEYLQKNTRYISIQLGIGGLQPFEAKFVAEKKYGDCKALSNYMVSLLKEAGIKGNVVVIHGGNDIDNIVYEDFPNNYFNHEIACVPNGKDTIWLECTSQTASAGYMGSFTGNRKSLLIDEDGGHIVNTPKYASSDNLQVCKTEGVIDENGKLSAEIFTRYTGLQQETVHGVINDINQEERTKYLNNIFNLSTYQIDKSDYKEIKGVIPSVNEYLKITSINYASVTGKRLFIQPNIFNKKSRIENEDSRKTDIVFRYAYKDVDSVFLKLPDGYTLESAPHNIKIESKFGTYEFRLTLKDGMLNLIRNYEQKEAVFPASDYAELVKFFDQMYKADHSKVVLVK